MAINMSKKVGPDIFIADCKLSDDKKTLQCTPEYKVKGMTLTSKRPVVMVLSEDNHVAAITDDGGVPDVVMDKLVKHVEKNTLVP